MINRLVHIFYLWRLSVCATATTNILSIRKDCVTQECSLVKRYNDVFFSLKFIGGTNRGRPGDAILVGLLFSLTVKSNLPSFWSPLPLGPKSSCCTCFVSEASRKHCRFLFVSFLFFVQFLFWRRTFTALHNAAHTNCCSFLSVRASCCMTGVPWRSNLLFYWFVYLRVCLDCKLGSSVQNCVCLSVCRECVGVDWYVNACVVCSTCS